MTTYLYISQVEAQAPPFFTAHGASLLAVTYPIRISSIAVSGQVTYPGPVFPIVEGTAINITRVLNVTTQSGTLTPALVPVRQGSPTCSAIGKWDTNAQNSPSVTGSSSQLILAQSWPANLIILPGSALYMQAQYGTAAGTPQRWYMYATFFFEELRLSWSF
jgi:hypothetical protein